MPQLEQTAPYRLTRAMAASQSSQSVTASGVLPTTTDPTVLWNASAFSEAVLTVTCVAIVGSIVRFLRGTVGACSAMGMETVETTVLPASVFLAVEQIVALVSW